jgi:hypothetical protein
VHRVSGDAQCLPGTNLDGRAVNRPGENALDAVEYLLKGVVLVAGAANFCPTGTRTSNTDTLPLESSPVRRKRIPRGPISIVSSEGLIRVVRCCIIAPSLEFGEKGPGRIPGPRRMAGLCLVV